MIVEQYSPDFVEDEKTQVLLSEVGKYIEENQGTVSPYSAEEYFLLLLDQGLKTREAGNYGIAAGLVVRSQGVETVIFGKNTVFTECNPHGHAEMNAVKNATNLLADDTGSAFLQSLGRGDVIVRPAPHDKDERFLITTLEPCPMCTVGSVINADVKRVLIGTEDEFAGALLGDRMERLAPLWPATSKKQHLEIVLTQSIDDTDQDTYVSPQLRDFLNRLFFDTKDRLDSKLDNEGFVDLTAIGVMGSRFIYE